MSLLFSSTISHQCWKYIDKNHPKSNPNYKGPNYVHKVYKLMDFAVGELLKTLNREDTNILIVSDHGFGSVYYGVYINNWLMEKNYLKIKKKVISLIKYGLFRSGFNLYNMLKIANKFGLIKSVGAAYSSDSLLMKLAHKLFLSYNDVDWENTLAYSFGNFGQIYINLKGREPKGAVNSNQYEVFLRKIAKEIKTITDDNGNQIFDKIIIARNLHRGSFSGEGPDIIFLDSEMLYCAHRLFELGCNKLITLHPLYSGNHKEKGILLYSGPSFKSMNSKNQLEVNVIDITPTILKIYGLYLPTLDGKPIPAVATKTKISEKMRLTFRLKQASLISHTSNRNARIRKRNRNKSITK